jgi:hypothetical protein
VIAQRAANQKPAPRGDLDADDDNYNASERWSPERRHNATVIAEGGKRSGELPQPRSSFRLTPTQIVGEGADIEELNFEADQ